KPSKLDKFHVELARLSDTIVDDLHLPSLKENRLEGFVANAGRILAVRIALNLLQCAIDNCFWEGKVIEVGERALTFCQYPGDELDSLLCLVMLQVDDGH